MNILIADDDPIARRCIAVAMRRAGHTIVEAQDGENALALLRDGPPPELILSDVLMPRMDGFSLCREVKADAGLASIPFVFYSGQFVDPEDRDLAYALGAERFLVKGANTDAFVNQIQGELAELPTTGSSVIQGETLSAPLLARMHRRRLLDTLYAQHGELTRHKQTLEGTERRLREVVETVPAVLFQADLPEFRFNFVSPAAEAMLGISIASLVADPQLWWRRVHDGDRERVRLELKDALASGRDNYVDQFRMHYGDDGALLCLEVRGTIHRDELGKAQSIFGAVTDITERYRVEQALRESERNYRNLFEMMLDGFATHEVINDDQGKAVDYRFLTVNPAFEQLTGLTRERVQGRRILDLLPDTESVWIERYGAVANHGEPARFEHYSRALGKHFEVMAFRNRPGQFVTIFSDITDRKQAEDRVRDLARLAAESPNPVLRVGIDGDLRYANGAAESWLDFHQITLGDPVPAPWAQAVRRALERGQTETLEVTIGVVFFSVTVVPVVAEGFANLYSADLTERLASERALRTLSACNETLVRAGSEADLVQGVCDVITLRGEYPMAWFAFGSGDRLDVSAHAVRSESGLARVDPRLLTQGPASRAWEQGRTVLVTDVAAEVTSVPWREAAAQFGFHSALALPVRYAGTPFGILKIYAAGASAFGEQEVELMEELASDLGYGIHARRMERERLSLELERQADNQRLERALMGTIEAVSLTIEKRDPFTAGHQRRVAQLAVELGRELALSDAQLEGLRMGSLIHDIGKVYVPAEILNRPGRLRDEEMGLVRAHPRVGHDIIKGVEFPWPVADMVLQHHERMDGSGYPDGLCGEAIAFEARIIAVADVVEAITSHRPYRASLGLQHALAEIEEYRASRYDATVADACLRLFRERGFEFEG